MDVVEGRGPNQGGGEEHSFSKWIRCACVIHFDVDFGHVLAYEYPKGVLTAGEKAALVKLSLPDFHHLQPPTTSLDAVPPASAPNVSAASEKLHEDIFFSFRFRRESRVPLTACASSHHDYSYGHSLFRTTLQANSRRNFSQESVVLVTPLAYCRLFRRLTTAIGSRYFSLLHLAAANDINSSRGGGVNPSRLSSGRPSSSAEQRANDFLKEVCHSVGAWPAPGPGLSNLRLRRHPRPRRHAQRTSRNVPPSGTATNGVPQREDEAVSAGPAGECSKGDLSSRGACNGDRRRVAAARDMPRGDREEEWCMASAAAHRCSDDDDNNHDVNSNNKDNNVLMSNNFSRDSCCLTSSSSDDPKCMKCRFPSDPRQSDRYRGRTVADGDLLAGSLNCDHQNSSSAFQYGIAVRNSDVCLGMNNHQNVRNGGDAVVCRGTDTTGADTPAAPRVDDSFESSPPESAGALRLKSRSRTSLAAVQSFATRVAPPLSNAALLLAAAGGAVPQFCEPPLSPPAAENDDFEDSPGYAAGRPSRLLPSETAYRGDSESPLRLRGADAEPLTACGRRRECGPLVGGGSVGCSLMESPTSSPIDANGLADDWQLDELSFDTPLQLPDPFKAPTAAPNFYRSTGCSLSSTVPHVPRSRQQLKAAVASERCGLTAAGGDCLKDSASSSSPLGKCSVIESGVGSGNEGSGKAMLAEVLASKFGSSFGCFEDVNVYSALRPVLSQLWAVWELVLVGDEPMLFLSSSPDKCSAAVQAAISLISPVVYMGDFRPYFNTFDPDFLSYIGIQQQPQPAGSSGRPSAVAANRADSLPPFIFGVTNPLFIEAFRNVPNIIILEGPRTSISSIASLVSSSTVAANLLPTGANLSAFAGGGNNGPPPRKILLQHASPVDPSLATLLTSASVNETVAEGLAKLTGALVGSSGTAADKTPFYSPSLLPQSSSFLSNSAAATLWRASSSATAPRLQLPDTTPAQQTSNASSRQNSPRGSSWTSATAAAGGGLLATLPSGPTDFIASFAASAASTALAALGSSTNTFPLSSTGSNLASSAMDSCAAANGRRRPGSADATEQRDPSAKTTTDGRPSTSAAPTVNPRAAAVAFHSCFVVKADTTPTVNPNLELLRRLLPETTNSTAASTCRYVPTDGGNPPPPPPPPPEDWQVPSHAKRGMSTGDATGRLTSRDIQEVNQERGSILGMLREMQDDEVQLSGGEDGTACWVDVKLGSEEPPTENRRTKEGGVVDRRNVSVMMASSHQAGANNGGEASSATSAFTISPVSTISANEGICFLPPHVAGRTVSDDSGALLAVDRSIGSDAGSHSLLNSESAEQPLLANGAGDSFPAFPQQPQHGRPGRDSASAFALPPIRVLHATTSATEEEYRQLSPLTRGAVRADEVGARQRPPPDSSPQAAAYGFAPSDFFVVATARSASAPSGARPLAGSPVDVEYLSEDGGDTSNFSTSIGPSAAARRLTNGSAANGLLDASSEDESSTRGGLAPTDVRRDGDGRRGESPRAAPLPRTLTLSPHSAASQNVRRPNSRTAEGGGAATAGRASVTRAGHRGGSGGRVAEECDSSSAAALINNGLVREHFKKMTHAFLQPFSAYFQIDFRPLMVNPLMPLPRPSTHIPSAQQVVATHKNPHVASLTRASARGVPAKAKWSTANAFLPFCLEDFIANLELQPPFTELPRARVERLYRRFVESSNYRAWFSRMRSYCLIAAAKTCLLYCLSADLDKLLARMTSRDIHEAQANIKKNLEEVQAPSAGATAVAAGHPAESVVVSPQDLLRLHVIRKKIKKELRRRMEESAASVASAGAPTRKHVLAQQQSDEALRNKAAALAGTPVNRGGRSF